MRILKQNRNTWLFLAFLLLGGALQAHDPLQYRFINTICYCVEYLIYAGLVLSWTQSLNQRLSPSKEKGYLLAAASLMLLFLAAQFTKYRISVTPALTRYCWYIYYIPILLIPTLFLMTCFRFLRGGNAKKPRELWFLLPAGLLVLGILTNDLHKKAFLPKEGILHQQAFLPNEGIAGLIGAPNTYTHGFLYFAAYAWAGCAMVAGVLFLLAACKKSGRWKKAFLPLIILILIPPVLMICSQLPEDTMLVEYEWPEIVIFSMLAVFEACIRSRLIPSNENYPAFFTQMELPALITDRGLNVVYQTQNLVPATIDQLEASLDVPVYPTVDMRLFGMKIRAGFAFWMKDESAVNRMNEELRDANEILQQENEILEREQVLTAEQAMIEERSRLYQKAAREVYPAQKKISEILEKTKPGTESFRTDIEKTLVLTAYVKRKANLVLVEAERGSVSAQELASAMEESAHYLDYCGMNTTADIKAQRDFLCREAMAVYDCFEATAEQLLGSTKEFYIRLKDDELLMMADSEDLPKGEMLPDLNNLSLPVYKSFADGQLILRATLGGETA